MSTTLTEPRTGKTSRPRMLRGLNWLFVRQHRATLGGVLALVVFGAAWILYQRADLIQTLDAVGWPEKEAPQDPLGQQFGHLSTLLNAIPVVLGVFLGAPLIAADQENGTAQLATTQSVTRRRWLAAKCAWGLGIALLAGTVLSVCFTWWWEPYRSVFPYTWMEGTIFDNTGPMLPALCLFLTAAGITIGVLLRRVLASMVVTFVFSTVVTVAWGEFRASLAPSRTFTYPLDEELPARLSETYELDRWIGSADGHLYGWGSCSEATEKASNACIKDRGIVNNVIEYLGYDQMAAMQWTGAGILLAGTALLTAFTLWQVPRRPL
ncbi:MULTISPECIES: ABC transporter permease [unclassified Streptomyces]|uniref:ABC transporter permease n=1 Tax=unclassified Streptomyces TaxID=2593676 RepID=UPI002DDC30A8|nr:ABC transporter permease [Streptomyces sp. NBC_01237]WRZ73315.1 ABC transporter permease [Streptomyces sp. NBC_01237]